MAQVEGSGTAVNCNTTSWPTWTKLNAPRLGLSRCPMESIGDHPRSIPEDSKPNVEPVTTWITVQL
jgi:hypothetical protein